MADQIRRVDYYYVEIPDKPGEGVRVLTAGGKAQLDLVVEDSNALAKAAKSASLNLSPKKQAFFVQGQNRAGAAADVLRKLADAKVNVRGANGSSGQGGFGMIVWVAPSDYAAAAKALGV